MDIRRFQIAWVAVALACIGGAIAVAQTSAGRQAGAGRGGAAPRTAKVYADLRQLMRGTLYPASNVIFAAQEDVSNLKPAGDPATSPNPLTSTYGGWQAVENAALAIAETASLVAAPGRMCSSGRPAPVQRADWQKYVQGLRDAGLTAYKAAQSKKQDAMVDAAGAVSDACSACHDVYREKKGGEKDRCLP
jgi:Cytochrome C'